MRPRNHLAMWIEPDWPAPDTIKAISTTRAGGYSEGVYASLNLGDHVGDNPLRVSKNRDKLTQTLALPDKINWLQQTHSTTVVQAETITQGAEADASYTHEAGVVCVVMTADCLPVILCDTQGSCIASIHCGWRGLANGIIEATLTKMTLTNNRLMAWLGPAIGADAFEVGIEVRACFIKQSPQFSPAFRALGKGKWLADIYALARLILSQQGIEKVYGGGLCTYSDPERFFSYRRDHCTGRMATLIWRRPEQSCKHKNGESETLNPRPNS